MRLNRSWRRKLLAKGFFAHHDFNPWERWRPAGVLEMSSKPAGRRRSQGAQSGSVKSLQLAAVQVLEIALAQGIGNKWVKVKVL
jgi:hypothetical protein